MINDFWEIKDENDRALYVRIRNLIDDWFLGTIKQHETKNHMAHECFNKELNFEKKKLDKFLETYKSKSEQKAVLLIISDEIALELVDSIQRAMVILDKADELVSKH